MKRIFVPARSADDWRALLANPAKHWRTGFSARALAHCWHSAAGFPVEVTRIFTQSGLLAFQHVEPLFAFPEYKVALPGGGSSSQADLFVLARTSDQHLCTIMVEGKVVEPFDRTVAEWIVAASTGKRKRLAALQQQLGLTDVEVGHIRYQLLHRTVAAGIEAQNLNARYAIMLVHSFSQQHQWFEDFQAFAALFGTHVALNQLIFLTEQQGIGIYAGWVQGDAEFLTR